MANSRYHMESKDHKFFIEGEYHEPGLEELKRIRKNHPMFKYMPIKPVLQCLPNEIPLYKIIERR